MQIALKSPLDWEITSDRARGRPNFRAPAPGETTSCSVGRCPASSQKNGVGNPSYCRRWSSDIRRVGLRFHRLRRARNGARSLAKNGIVTYSGAERPVWSNVDHAQQRNPGVLLADGLRRRRIAAERRSNRRRIIDRIKLRSCDRSAEASKEHPTLLASVCAVMCTRARAKLKKGIRLRVGDSWSGFVSSSWGRSSKEATEMTVFPT